MSDNTFDSKLKKTNFWKRLPRWAKVIIISFHSLLLLFVILLVGLSWYISNNKTNLLKQINATVNENLEGNFKVEDLDLAIFQTFPDVSLRLKNITLSDSLYHKHQINMVNVKSVYAHFKLFSIFKGSPNINKVTIADGNFHLFVDINGYTNTYLLKKKEKKHKEKKDNTLDITAFVIKNVAFTFDEALKNKQFKIDLNEIKGNLHTINEQIEIQTDLNLLIHQLGFNLDRGGFLKNAKLSSDLKIIFHKNYKQLFIPNTLIYVNEQKINLEAVFNLSDTNKKFTLKIDAPALPFDQGRALLSRHIAAKLDSINTTKPLKVYADIQGKMHYPDTPTVLVNFSTENNELKVAGTVFKNVQFAGRFNNAIENIPNHSDENSVIFLDKFRADWEEIPLIVDSSYIKNLKDPVLNAKIKSSFPVEKLDNISGNSFSLRKGRAEVNLLYNGPINQNNLTDRSVNGYIYINNAALTYLPRNLKFDNCNAKLQFTGKDLFLKDINLSVGSSVVKMEGAAMNFLSAYFNDKLKAVFNLNITAPSIDLNQYKTFLTQRKKASTTSSSASFRRMNNQLDNLLGLSDMHLNVSIGQIVYNKFKASNIHAGVDLLSSGIALRNVNINHAGGNVQLSGALDQSKSNNPFNINVQMHQVDVHDLFYAFDNFGMQSLTSKNIKGKFSGDIKVSGGMTNSGDITPRSFFGSVKFGLQDAAIMDFKPFLQIQKYIFKGRNLNNVTIKSLNGEFDVNKGMVTIHPMEIITSALYMKMQGVYGMEKGTDISIEVPLRNPAKDEVRIAKGLAPKRTAGLVVYLRALDDGKGGVKISWDPQKKGLKQDGIEEAIQKEEKEEANDTAIVNDTATTVTSKKEKKKKNRKE